MDETAKKEGQALPGDVAARDQVGGRGGAGRVLYVRSDLAAVGVLLAPW